MGVLSTAGFGQLRTMLTIENDDATDNFVANKRRAKKHPSYFIISATQLPGGALTPTASQPLAFSIVEWESLRRRDVTNSCCQRFKVGGRCSERGQVVYYEDVVAGRRPAAESVSQ